jgi:hypothetical protein
MKVFCLAPSIWPTLHYEADLILQEANKSSEAITVITCNKFRQDCPANKLKSELVCTVCRMRNRNLRKFINSRFDENKVNFVNFKNIARYNKKESFKKYFGNDKLTIYKELLKSVLSSQQTSKKTKGFKSWGYDELSKPFWDTHFNFIETINQIIDDQKNISACYIYNCRLSGYKAIYEYMKHFDVDRYVYEYPIEEKKRLFIQKNSLVHEFGIRSQLMKIFCDKFENHSLAMNKIGYRTIWGRTQTSDRIGEYNFSNFKKTIEPKNKKEPKFILITNSSEWETFGCKGSVVNFFGDQVRAIRETCRYFEKKNPEIKFILRVHPQYSFRDKLTLGNIMKLSKFRNLEIIGPEENTDTYKLIKESHFVITFYSYSGPEAVVRGKKLIILGPASYQSFKIGVFPKNKLDFYNNIQKYWGLKNPISSKSEIAEALKFAFARRFYGKRTKNLIFRNGSSFLKEKNGASIRLDGGVFGKTILVFIKVIEVIFDKNKQKSFNSLLKSYLLDPKKLKRSIIKAIQ